MPEQEFRRVISLERQRSERSRTFFLLMLLDAGDCTPSEKNGKLLEKILATLAASIRDTDVAGWYKNNSTLGVIWTEFGSHDRRAIQSAMMTRVGDTLRRNLSPQQFNQISLAIHWFPEEWHDFPRRHTDGDAPVYAPRKPRPHLRSGGATAIPEPDDTREASPTNSLVRATPLSIEDSSALTKSELNRGSAEMSP